MTDEPRLFKDEMNFVQPDLAPAYPEIFLSGNGMRGIAGRSRMG